MTRATHASLGGRLRLRRAPVRSVDVTGDTAAFEAVYHDCHQELYRYARSIVRDEHVAEDVLQSVMEKALAALQTEERDFELRPWLFRVTHNEAISRLRQDKPTSELPDALATGARGLDEQLDDQDKLDTLWADLQALPSKQRQSLVLRELSGLSHEEIASVIDSTARAVKQTIFEARRALLECEEGRGMVCDDVQRQLSDGDGRVRRGRRMQAHLRSCRDCRAFDRALNDRPQSLRALAPALPVATAAGLLAQLVPGAKLASGAGAAAGAAGTATAGGLATTGGWSLGTLGGAFATKTAVVAATTVAAVGATGAVVVERAQDPAPAAAPAVGAGAAPRAGAASAGAAASGGSTGRSPIGAAATTPDDADRAPGTPVVSTPATAPRETTPGSTRGQERRAPGQARAAEARAAAPGQGAGGASESRTRGKSPTKASRKPGAPSKSGRAKTKQGSTNASPSPSKQKGSQRPTSSNSAEGPKSSPSQRPEKRGGGPEQASPKAPAASAPPETSGDGSGGPNHADQGSPGASKKPSK